MLLWCNHLANITLHTTEIPFFETSAKAGDNVEAVFVDLVRGIAAEFLAENGKAQPSESAVDLSASNSSLSLTPQKKKRCYLT